MLPARWILLPVVAMAPAAGHAPAPDPPSQAVVRHMPPTVVPNDNRVTAGRLERGVLRVHLVAQMARWYPDGPEGAWVDVVALAEEGGAPQIPAPLLRVREGTALEVTVRNALPDSTLHLHGLQARPAVSVRTLLVPPGASRTVRFSAGAAGTYFYRATGGDIDADVREREQAAGAFVIDAPGARTDDRIFVINIWGEPVDSATYRNAMGINGRSWPHTERLTSTVGDSARWRVVNASRRTHPMHMHGFFFRVVARGDGMVDTAYAPAAHRLAVTERMLPGTTMGLEWKAERPGNWLFHCHLAFHVVEHARLSTDEHEGHAGHGPLDHMAGLVLGLVVEPGAGWTDPPRTGVQRLHLFVNEGPPKLRAKRSMSYVLQQGTAAPAADSVEIPGTPIILTKGVPVDITVHNRLDQETSVHWHGIELESWSDGVPGWSGIGSRVAPRIAPRDSFVARLTLPRAGTFIYHTHLHDIEQLTSGLYGAMIVLEPGQRHDPARDLAFVAAWDGTGGPGAFPVVVNGGATEPDVRTQVGVRHRFRFINIGPAFAVRFAVVRDSALVTWRAIAKDGADLPPHAALTSPASLTLSLGETADTEFVPDRPGVYQLQAQASGPGGRLFDVYLRRIVVQ